MRTEQLGWQGYWIQEEEGVRGLLLPAHLCGSSPATPRRLPPHTKISTLRRGRQGEVLKRVRARGASGVREGGLESLAPEGAGGSPWPGRGELGKEGEGTGPRPFSVTCPLGQSGQ